MFLSWEPGWSRFFVLLWLDLSLCYALPEFRVCGVFIEAEK